MTTDSFPAQSQSHPLQGQRRSDGRNSPQSPRWGRGLVAIAIVAGLVSAAVLIPGAISSPQIGPKLTHTIARGDLLVTVTEQGRLESSENTEIKCKVRGSNTVIWVIDSGSEVKPGEVLLRLDSKFIEGQVSERSKFAHWSRSSAERSKANVERAELAISEYENGRYRAQLMILEKDLAVAEANLRSAENMLSYSKLMASRGYVSDLRLEARQFAVTRAKLEVEGRKTEIKVQETYVKREQSETLSGNFKAAQANHKANAERALADASRRDRAVEESKHCVVKAEQGGMVIHPSAARWENAPRIAEGSTVYKDQVLLLMPDLSKMQVKVGIREAVIDQIKPELIARVTLPDRTLLGKVSSVADITKPSGWWTGNIVKYDTIITLPSVDGLKPGMSAEVEVIIARHENVLTIPVAAIVETEEGDFCWVKKAGETRRHGLRLGDSNGVFTLVEAGLTEGDEVGLNPFALEEPQAEGLGPPGEAKSRKSKSKKPDFESSPQETKF